MLSAASKLHTSGPLNFATLAVSLLLRAASDRVVHNAYKIELKGESMRKKKATWQGWTWSPARDHNPRPTAPYRLRSDCRTGLRQTVQREIDR